MQRKHIDENEWKGRNSNLLRGSSGVNSYRMDISLTKPVKTSRHINGNIRKYSMGTVWILSDSMRYIDCERDVSWQDCERVIHENLWSFFSYNYRFFIKIDNLTTSCYIILSSFILSNWRCHYLFKVIILYIL